MVKTRETHSYKTPQERFNFYLKYLFGGNQRRMAEETSLSQSVISKIVLGKQDPGSRVLKLLSQHPKVNPAWLLSGEGDPLVTARKSHGDQGWPLPVSEVLLLGPPSTCRELLTSHIELVAGVVYRESAYVYLLTDNIPEAQMQAGDRILMDANPRRWRRNLRVLDGKLCAVRQHTASGPHIELHRVNFSLTEEDQNAELWISTMSEIEVVAGYGKAQRIDPTATEEEFQQSSSTRGVIAVDDIVAIAIQLFRDL